MSYRDETAALEARLSALQTELKDHQATIERLEHRLSVLQRRRGETPEKKPEERPRPPLEPTPTRREIRALRRRMLFVLTAAFFFPLVVVTVAIMVQ